jgi:SAM-dependent methyltransferase
MARHDECAAVEARYARRSDDEPRYGLLNATDLLMVQERQRAIARVLRVLRHRDLSKVHLLEVGCGGGGNLLEFLRFGFRPDHMIGIELLHARAERARAVLPSSAQIICGDAARVALAVPAASQDIVYQATVFSSLLSNEFQQQLADTMWRWVRPGGGVLWYDFTVNNPRNPDVRGVSVQRIRQLFPNGTLSVQRLTLAPPIARAATRLHPSLYGVLNSCIWLRTHVLAWIAKADL